jgi:hypothetical protein
VLIRLLMFREPVIVIGCSPNRPSTNSSISMLPRSSGVTLRQLCSSSSQWVRTRLNSSISMIPAASQVGPPNYSADISPRCFPNVVRPGGYLRSDYNHTARPKNVVLPSRPIACAYSSFFFHARLPFRDHRHTLLDRFGSRLGRPVLRARILCAGAAEVLVA